MNNEPSQAPLGSVPPTQPQPSPAPEQQPVPAPQPMFSQEPVAAPEPPKKRKKALLITLVIAGLVILGLVIFAIVQMQRANQAASTYTQAVRDHVGSIYSKDTSVKERAELAEAPVSLQPIFAGTVVSGEYREAVELEARYDTLIDNTVGTLKEIYTFIDFSSDETPFISTVGTLATTPSPGFSVTTDDPSLLAGSEEFINKVEDKAKQYTALADRMASYSFPESLSDEQKTIVDGLKGMADAEKQKATVQREYNEKTVDAGFNPEESQKALDDVKAASELTVSNYEKVRTALQALVKEYISGDVQRITEESQKVDTQYSEFVDSLK